MPKNRLVLAYSGGLDTSFCIPYLRDRGYEIHAVNVDSGGFSVSDISEMKERAMTLGASHFSSIKIEDNYYDKCIKYLIFGNVLRNNTYPLSVSSERPFQALAILDYCKKHQINTVAHGSTGAGNDQIRFDLIFKSLAPQINILAPIREKSLSRAEEINYLKERGFVWDAVQKDYSINVGVWGTSIGGKETLTSDQTLPESAFPSQLSQTAPQTLSLNFSKGELVAIDGRKDTPLSLIKELSALAKKYSIGRDIHVGDTIIGIKGRVGFEAGAPLMLLKAHELLEKHTLTKWQIHWKKQLADWYGMMLHEGQYLEPLMRNIEVFLETTQSSVNGLVKVKLLPYRFNLIGISSDDDLMKSEFGTYGEENLAWSGEDAKGFIQIMSNAPKIYYNVHKNEIPCLK